jgi:hypothetical protein
MWDWVLGGLHSGISKNMNEDIFHLSPTTIDAMLDGEEGYTFCGQPIEVGGDHYIRDDHVKFIDELDLELWRRDIVNPGAVINCDACILLVFAAKVDHA